jgi:hypothetical protein
MRTRKSVGSKGGSIQKHDTAAVVEQALPDLI